MQVKRFIKRIIKRTTQRVQLRYVATRVRVLFSLALAGLVCVSAGHARADCFEASGQRYQIDPGLLRAIARAESSMQADAINTSHQARTGTIDIGLMQINTGWLPALARHGITQSDLFEPCTNVAVGAWILARLFARHGDQWEAVGAYNAACTSLKGEACRKARTGYAWRVFRRVTGQASATRLAQPSNPRVSAVAVPPMAGDGGRKSSGLVSVAALVEPGVNESATSTATATASATATVMATPSKGEGL